MPSTLSPQRGFSEALLEARSLKVPETHSYWVSGGHGTSSAPLSLSPYWVFSPSRLRPPTKAQDSGNGESRERPSKSCYSPHPRPLLKLELEAATMISAVTQKSFIYSITHKWGKRTFGKQRCGIQGSVASCWLSQTWHRWCFGAREFFVAGAVQLYRWLLSARCHKNPLSPAGCGNQNCLQTLPKVPWGTKFSPVEKHRPSGSETL